MQLHPFENSWNYYFWIFPEKKNLPVMGIIFIIDVFFNSQNKRFKWDKATLQWVERTTPREIKTTSKTSGNFIAIH